MDDIPQEDSGAADREGYSSPRTASGTDGAVFTTGHDSEFKRGEDEVTDDPTVASLVVGLPPGSTTPTLTDCASTSAVQNTGSGDLSPVPQKPPSATNRPRPKHARSGSTAVKFQATAMERHHRTETDPATLLRPPPYDLFSNSYQQQHPPHHRTFSRTTTNRSASREELAQWENRHGFQVSASMPTSSSVLSDRVSATSSDRVYFAAGHGQSPSSTVEMVPGPRFPREPSHSSRLPSDFSGTVHCIPEVRSGDHKASFETSFVTIVKGDAVKFRWFGLHSLVELKEDLLTLLPGGVNTLEPTRNGHCTVVFPEVGSRYFGSSTSVLMRLKVVVISKQHRLLRSVLISGIPGIILVGLFIIGIMQLVSWLNSSHLLLPETVKETDPDYYEGARQVRNVVLTYGIPGISSAALVLLASFIAGLVSWLRSSRLRDFGAGYTERALWLVQHVLWIFVCGSIALTMGSWASALYQSMGLQHFVRLLFTGIRGTADKALDMASTVQFVVSMISQGALGSMSGENWVAGNSTGSLVGNLVRYADSAREWITTGEDMLLGVTNILLVLLFALLQFNLVYVSIGFIGCIKARRPRLLRAAAWAACITLVISLIVVAGSTLLLAILRRFNGAVEDYGDNNITRAELQQTFAIPQGSGALPFVEFCFPNSPLRTGILSFLEGGRRHSLGTLAGELSIFAPLLGENFSNINENTSVEAMAPVISALAGWLPLLIESLNQNDTSLIRLLLPTMVTNVSVPPGYTVPSGNGSGATLPPFPGGTRSAEIPSAPSKAASSAEIHLPKSSWTSATSSHRAMLQFDHLDGDISAHGIQQLTQQIQFLQNATMPTFYAFFSLYFISKDLMSCRDIFHTLQGVAVVANNEVISPLGQFVWIQVAQAIVVLIILWLAFLTAHCFDRPRKHWYYPSTDRWFLLRACFHAHCKVVSTEGSRRVMGNRPWIPPAFGWYGFLEGVHHLFDVLLLLALLEGVLLMVQFYVQSEGSKIVLLVAALCCLSPVAVLFAVFNTITPFAVAVCRGTGLLLYGAAAYLSFYHGLTKLYASTDCFAHLRQSPKPASFFAIANECRYESASHAFEQGVYLMATGITTAAAGLCCFCLFLFAASFTRRHVSRVIFHKRFVGLNFIASSGRISGTSLVVALIFAAVFIAIFANRLLFLTRSFQTQTLPICNGGGELCARRVNEIVWPTAHHAASSLESEFIGPNHYYALEDQLIGGFRAFTASVFDDPALHGIDEASVPHRAVICRKYCQHGTWPLKNLLGSLGEFLERNTSEVVILLLSQQVETRYVVEAFEQVNLIPHLWEANVEQDNLSSLASFQWPTLQELIFLGTRILVFTDVHLNSTLHGGSSPPLWLHPTSDFFIVLDQGVAANTSDFGCEMLNEESTQVSGLKMLILNHFVEVLMPMSKRAVQVNAASSIEAHLENCTAVWARRPSLVVVDFWHIGDVARTVQHLNLNTSFT